MCHPQKSHTLQVHKTLKPANKGQFMKHNRACVGLQKKLVKKIEVLGKEVEISQLDCAISTHWDTAMTQAKDQIV